MNRDSHTREAQFTAMDAPLAVFLASDESAWITGEIIRAAGGLVGSHRSVMLLTSKLAVDLFI
jgi:hypothetical protein